MSNNGIETFVLPKHDKYTEPLAFIPGKYTLSQAGQVPYFSAVIPLQDLVNQIKLVEDIPEEARLTWSLEELFQRDINWQRVHNELVNGYLKDPNKLNFFNSLTIALLPQDGLKIENQYGEPEYSPSPTINNEDWKKIDVGNICVEFNQDESIGILRWHKERIIPVAIDGQHRLAALKQYCEDLTPGISHELNTKIPLILLILDNRVGFEERHGKSLIETLREIFIDLNRNARGVAKSRLILLDDLNIQSFCVRTLLASHVTDVSTDVLPLSMVTWREDDAKFDVDSGHSITTVLNLNEIVDICLGGAALEVSDLLGETEVRRYVGNIKSKLELTPEVQQSIDNHLQLCINRVEPFSFKTEHLNTFKEAFRLQWTPHIVQVFREFAPYKKYLLKAEEIGAVDRMLADYLLSSKENRENFKNRKKEEDRTFDPHTKIDVPLTELQELKRNEWAFYVVFQKALFINFFGLDAQRQEFSGREIGDTRESFLTWWLEHINALHERGVFNLDWKAGKSEADLWLGIANNPVSGTIQYSRAAANRISAFMTICLWFNSDPAQPEAKAFATSLIEETNIELPTIVRNAFSRTLRPGLVSLIRAKIDTDDPDDEKLMKRMIKSELVKRLKATQG